MTTLAKPVPITSNDNYPYKVYALIKIKNRRGLVTKRKKGILKLVLVDVYGPI